MMRKPRVKETRSANYHVFSRVVNGEWIFNREEKELFVTLMRRVEAFCGVKILTYTVLSNHFHILVHIPKRKRRNIGDEEFLRRLSQLYCKREVRRVEKKLCGYREKKQEAAAEALKARYTYRMYDLSEFGKTLLQRFSQSYNTRHERTGTLWEGRFGSLLADKSIEALGATAAYIDLNAVRAGLVQDPVDYRWSGYAEAVAGSRQAREGLGMVMLSRGQSPDWDRAAGKYRRLLYTTGQAKGVSETGGALKPGFSPEDVKRVLEAGGKLPLNVVLRCRVRYFTAGLVLGTRAYVEHIQHRHGAQICSARGTGPSAMIGCDWGDLFVNHQLKGDLITVPGC